MQPQHQNYTRHVIANQEEALSKIVAKVPHGALVLDVGCGSGMMGRFLSENNECVVDGVDIDPEAIALARPKYRNIAVANLERDSLMAFFQPGIYDCIVVADVADHLVHPEQLFEDIKKLLKPDGRLLFSIPNISHISAGLELILGKFGYQNSGLLDSTHVRFYSRQGFVDKLASSGIYVEEIDTVQRDFDKTEFAGYEHFPQHWVRDIVASRDDALTYQWIMTARLFKSAVAKTRTIGLPEADSRHISLNARAYWRSAFDHSFSEINSVFGTVVPGSAGEPSVDFDFTEANCRYPLAALRVDLVSDNTAFVFYEATLTSAAHQTLWAARTLGEGELVNAIAVSAPAGDAFQGTAVLPESDDPQWHPALGEAVLSAVTPGAKLRISMNASPDRALPIMLAAFTVRAAALAQRTSLLADTQMLLQAKIVETEQLHAALRAVQLQLAETTAKAAANGDHFQVLAAHTGDSLLAKTAEIEQLHAALRSLQLQHDDMAAKSVACADHFQKLAAQTDESLLAKTVEIEQLHVGLRTVQLQLGETAAKAAADGDHFQKLAAQTAESLRSKTAEIEQLHIASRSGHLQLEEMTTKGAAVDHFQKLALQTDKDLRTKTAEIEQLHVALHQERHTVSTIQVDARNLQASVSQLQVALSEQAHHLQATQASYTQALGSLSWRVTKPLRWVRQKLR